MTDEQIKALRTALIAVLDSEHGINAEGAGLLKEALSEPDVFADIWAATTTCKGAVFLLEDHCVTP